MVRTKGKPPNAIENVAKLELLLAQLSQDHEAATYHRNPLVDECLSEAQDDLRQAMNAILRADLPSAKRLSDIAWLRIDFGRQLLDADAVEHLLGDSDYLELAEAPVPPEKMVGYLFFQLERQVLKLYSELHNPSQTE